MTTTRAKSIARRKKVEEFENTDKAAKISLIG